MLAFAFRTIYIAFPVRNIYIYIYNRGRDMGETARVVQEWKQFFIILPYTKHYYILLRRTLCIDSLFQKTFK
jgi:hypothetical protein